MQSNVLMCRFVCELLPPTRQAHLRSAGSVGYDAFEELVALGDVPVYVEVVTEGGGDDDRFGALMNAPIRGVKKPMRRKPKRQVPEEHVIVFWERAMRRRPIPQPHWSKLPWVSVRYHYDVHADRSSDSASSASWASVMPDSKATYIDLRGVEEVEETPTGLLRNCEALEVELSRFRNIHTIGDEFMNSAAAAMDLYPFSKVHTIKNLALAVYQPYSIDLWPLRNVVKIGDAFMPNSLLKSIDLSPFVSLKTIGTGFMSSSVNLEEIDLSPLSTVVSIGCYFLTASPKLTSVDLRPLKSISSLGGNCLATNCALRSVILPTFDNPQDAVRNNFLYHCIALNEIDLSPLHNMTAIPERFLNHCSSLTSLDITPFTNITSVGGGFLSHCSALTSIDLQPLSKVNAPLIGLLDGCTSLVDLDLSHWHSLPKKKRRLQS